ncbi:MULTISPECIES: prolipoprotein diacylglyceryl transferase [Lactiplantibacillus]|uniref:Phosphatidylglycerol--prolipoprotein diacylglyceryl transferase n=3 Tax=Lactiplantibacillus pentosus TaxID=1589 RepID=A0A2I0Z5Y7_LACPE|nr:MULTISPECIES: prolipoprotein diacylglyceryl transferase [Lactiplantibacillus]MBU7446898.1 prolipoprotein diacylglyceryl transferase [Lactiplantibacillus sp. 7.2.4]MBU7484200.1 prolipoprotein diacylglyceryl transferase [Lactiplantibacillus sp. 30.2.29]AUI79590.1 prolipoprotein diacylglyceryl transferase [Lactiplantibacillus pentosus]AYG36537.1 prolipoprotein diacylglyceryl transferase [Lactiplantibacillus pentosus]AYG42165.1 prolipoprotein diacylglyceryl transferase [Lactiplantibacillus pent
MNTVLGALNPIALRLGPIQVHWYGVIIASAVVIAVALAVREGQKRGIRPDDIYDMILWALPFTLIAARTYYVIFQWSYYSQHPSEIIRIWDGGIAIYGGLIGAGIVVVLFCRSRFIPTWLMLDVAAPTVIMGQGIGRWGNFMNQEAFGRVTSLSFLQGLHLPEWLINQMYIQGAYRQPTFLYESVWDLLGFVMLMVTRHRTNWYKQGEVFLTYVAWYAFGRFFTEGMRTDSLMLFNVIRVSQALSVVLFFGSIGLMIWRRRRHPENRWYLAGSGQKIATENK